jgi:glycosyltransferase involved in cell wall biosynthesis
VKLLEAFAAGIPCVSTTLGAEGLARKDGDVCALADTPAAFAEKIIYLLDHPAEARAMADRARGEVVENWDMAKLTARLEQSYRRAVEQMRMR